MILALALVGAASAAPGPGEGLRLAVGVDGGVDLPGTHDGTAVGAGPGLYLPLRIRLAEGADLRVTLAGFGLFGHDRVEWNEQTVDWYSDTHRSVYSAGTATVGGEFGFAPQRAVDPYLGVGAGLGVVGGWHTFSGGTASLRTGSAATQRDSLQCVPTLGGDVGIRLNLAPKAQPGGIGVAVEVEAGYSVSFLPEAPLGEVPTAFGASRTAFALDRARMGFGVSFPLM